MQPNKQHKTTSIDRSLYPYNYSTNVYSLSINNRMNLSIGKLNHSLIVLPLQLHLHPHFFTDINIANHSAILAYNTLIQHLSTIIDSVQQWSIQQQNHNKSMICILREKQINKLKPKIITTDNIIFSYVFRDTAPAYHLFTCKNNNNSDTTPTTHHNNTIADDDVQYNGGKYQRYQVSAHTLHVRCILAEHSNTTSNTLHEFNQMNSTIINQSLSPSPPAATT